jgi:hypothetical protein
MKSLSAITVSSSSSLLLLLFAAALTAVVTLSGCASKPAAPTAAAQPGWITLLDGTRGLDNFDRVGDSNWTAADGAIQADKRGKDTGCLVTKNSYGNFQLVVEFWSSPDANSGIFIRCANPKAITDKTCYEANIFDQRPDPAFSTGGIVHHGKVIKPMKVGGQWTTMDFTAYGSIMVVTVNGVKTAEIDHDQFARGPIALQHGAGTIKFRKVSLKPL